MKKKIYLCFLIIFMVSVLISCDKKTSKTSKTLRLSFQTEPYSLDPRIGVNVTSESAIRFLFESLMKISKTGDVTYGIAESYDVSEDQKTYTFILRDASWSDGKKVTAYDFEYAWKSAVAPDSQCNMTQMFYPIKNVKKIRDKLLPVDSMGVKSLDEKTLQIELENPTPFFIKALSNTMFSPIRKELDNSSGEQILVSNGPFYLKNYEPNKVMHFIKNSHYYLKDQIKIDDVEISFIKDDQTAMYMFENKEIDFIGNPISKIPFEEEEKLIKSNKLNIKPVGGVYWLGLNVDKFPYNNLCFRKALAYSLDNTLFSKILNNKTPAKTFVPQCFSDLKEVFSWYDVNKAKEQLSLALSELNCDIESLPTLKLTYCDQISGGRKVALLIKKQWEDNLNVKVELEEMEWNRFLSSLFSHESEIAGIQWFSYIEDASYHLETFKLKSYSSNWSGWENEKYIKNVNESYLISDPEKRADLLSNAEKIILDEMPVIPLYYEDYRFLLQENIHGVVINELGELDFRYCYIE